MFKPQPTERSTTGRRLLPTAKRLGLGLVTAAVITAIVVLHSYRPGAPALYPGQPSPQTLRAPRAAHYQDREATEELRRQASERTSPVYTSLPFARFDAEESVALAVEQVRNALQGNPRESRARLLSRLGIDVLPPELGPQDLTRIKEQALAAVQQAMAEEIRDQPEDLARARNIARMAAERSESRPAYARLAAAIAAQAVVSNSSYDRRATEKARREAARLVKPVEKTVLAGEILVRQGERVTSQQVEMLAALGLTRQQVDYLRVLGILLLVGGALGLIGLYLRYHLPDLYANGKLLALISLVLSGSLLVAALPGPPNLSMLSVTAGVMVIAILIHSHPALLAALLLGMVAGAMGEAPFTLTVLTLGSSLAGLCAVPFAWPASRLARAGAIIGAANLALLAILGWIDGESWQDIGSQAGLGALYGIGAPGLAVAAVMLLQRPFDIITHIRLLELSNPNEPLLRRMMLEAPGTYHSCMIVANLADAAADQVGADPLLARVGAYYHDIGKLRRPYFFVENQGILGTGNVHDRLSPSLSSLVITSHVKDGVELARQHRLPGGIANIIRQHHGTGLVSYFYHQALTADQRGEVQQEQFRYAGPKPHTKEAAIIMLADSAQAAVQSLPEPTPARVEATVREIIRERLADGQLAECPLTMGDLTAIQHTFVRVLNGMLFHTRIEYPDLLALEGKRIGSSADSESAKPARGSRPSRKDRQKNRPS